MKLLLLIRMRRHNCGGIGEREEGKRKGKKEEEERKEGGACWLPKVFQSKKKERNVCEKTSKNVFGKRNGGKQKKVDEEGRLMDVKAFFGRFLGKEWGQAKKKRSCVCFHSNKNLKPSF